MRQAGRYLPEYKATRARAGSFMGLATNPQYATEVTLQPLERYRAGRGDPVLRHPHRARRDGPGPVLRRRAKARASRTRCATRRRSPRWPCPTWTSCATCSTPCASIRKALDGRVPLIGFSGSPWTLACYMVEGGGSDDYRLVKTLMYARPDLMHRILDINAQAVAAYLNAQIDAGAQAVMIFDSWGGVLADGAFQRFSLHYTQQVVRALKREQRRPARAAASSSPRAAGPGCSRSPASAPTWSAWTGPSTSARRAPASATRWRCRATSTRTCCSRRPQVVRAQAIATLDSFGPPQRADGRWDGHVFNLGHGISQHTPPEHVAALVDAVHSHSRSQRAAAARWAASQRPLPACSELRRPSQVRSSRAGK